MDSASNPAGHEWVDKFPDEYPLDDCDPVDKTLVEALQKYLLSNGTITAAEVARQVDKCFYDWLSEVSKHPESFIQDFYDINFCLAKVISYGDVRQDRLVEVMLELRKLPTRQLKIWGEDSLVWSREPVIEERVEERWSRTIAPGLINGSADCSKQEKCDRYINCSSFLARILEAGLLDHLGEARYKYADAACHDGLEVAISNKQRRDCEVMVAVQYMLLAGRAMANEWAKKGGGDAAPARWKRWAEKLQEISRQEDEYGSLAPLAKQAYDRMVSLAPEIDYTSGDASVGGRDIMERRPRAKCVHGERD